MTFAAKPAVAESISATNNAAAVAKGIAGRLVGRNVVGAVLLHCIYACTAIPEDRPLTHVVGGTPCLSHPGGAAQVAARAGRVVDQGLSNRSRHALESEQSATA